MAYFVLAPEVSPQTERWLRFGLGRFARLGLPRFAPYLVLVAALCQLGCQGVLKSSVGSTDPSSKSSTSSPSSPSTPTITWATPGAISYGTALTSAQLDATASTAGTFSYSPVSGAVLGAGGQKLSVTFTPANTTDYTSATASVNLTVAQAKPAITWPSPSAISYGAALSSAQLDATASVPGTFAYTPPAGTVLAAGTQTLSVTFTPNDAADYTSASESVTLAVNSVSSSGKLSLTTTACPGGTQGAAYAGCTLVATGGSAPYRFSVDATGTYAPLPEGLVVNTASGVISSSQIGGEGTYVAGLIVTDNGGDVAENAISFAIVGSNAYLPSIFPASSIFHHRMDAATTSLPVDASPAAAIYSGYLTSTIKPFFGGLAVGNYPNGIPAFEVPSNQADVSVTTTMYQSYFTSGPIPANAPVEGTAYNVPSEDGHVLIYQQAGGGNPSALWEMWQGQLQPGGSWSDSSNALWPNASSNALTSQGMGTSDAAGLPIAPLLLNADEVIGTGTPASPNGTVQHPTRFTLNHGLNYWVWPATESAGVGSCSSGSGSIPTESLISQASPPVSCTFSGAFGEIYRLKASVANPSCAATSPQASIIIAALRNYGIIMADNGSSGGLIGTPDSRWNDSDLSCLRSLTLADFEPVNVSSLEVNSSSGATH